MTVVADPSGASRNWMPFDLGVDEPVSDGPPAPEPRPRRRIRTRRLLALPVAAVLFAVGGKLVTMAWFAHDGADAYAAARYQASASSFDRLLTINVIDPWRAWMNIGAARFRQRDLNGAEAAFSRALDIDPRRCEARFNLAVTVEAQGDRLMGDNVRDVTDADKVDGLARYRVALDIVNAATCRMDGTASAGFRLADTRQRLEAKLGADQDMQDQIPDDFDEDSDDELTAEETDENQSLQERIEQRNRDGESERQDASDIDPSAEQQPRDPNW